MPQSATPAIRFAVPASLPLEATFDGGRLTSNGGLPWFSEAEAALGVCAAFAACVPEWRRGPVRHSLATLVRQRVFQIACGYEDQDDADTLRTDRCSSWSAAACRRPGLIWRVNRRSRAWKMPWTGGPATGWRSPWATSTCASGHAMGSRPHPDRPGQHRRSDPRSPRRHRFPRVLWAAHVSSVAALRRGDRPPHHRGPAPRQRDFVTLLRQ